LKKRCEERVTKRRGDEGESSGREERRGRRKEEDDLGLI